MYCVPGPIRPPRANRKTSLSGPSSPPDGESTSPVRGCTTRAPASRAGWAAASQSRHDARRGTRGPTGADSSMRDPAGVAVVADGRLADQDVGTPCSATARGEHVGGHVAAVADRLPARPAPRPVRDADAAEVHHRVDAVERARVDPPGGRVPAALVGCGGLPPDQAQHFVPAARRWATRAVPIRAGRSGDDDAHAAILAETGAARTRPPGARMTSPGRRHPRTVTTSNSPSSSRARTARDEAAGVGAVDEPVVVGQRQVADRPDRDDVVAVRSVTTFGSLDDRAGAQDRDLRLDDDRGVEQRARRCRCW